MKKFRAWDIAFKRFRDEFDWIVEPETGQPLKIHFDGSFGEGEWIIQSKAPYILEQYIGLNDANNQEIYEGDIVRIYDNKTKRTFTGEVIFKNASFCIETDIAIHYRWIDYVITKLGNKHEDTQIILREGL